MSQQNNWIPRPELNGKKISGIGTEDMAGHGRGETYTAATVTNVYYYPSYKVYHAQLPGGEVRFFHIAACTFDTKPSWQT